MPNHFGEIAFSNTAAYRGREVLKVVVFIKRIEAMQILPSKTYPSQMKQKSDPKKKK